MERKFDFETDRLIFRRWKEEDKEPFQIMNQDPEVMMYMPKVLTSEESDAFVERINTHFDEHGYSLWAIEEKESAQFIGFIGFYTATFQSDFTPCVEIGWRLAREFWYKGYATEGAQACLDYGINTIKLTEIYSFTSKINEKSIKVMKKIGLQHLQDFEHPNLNEGNVLRPHVLYGLKLK